MTRTLKGRACSNKWLAAMALGCTALTGLPATAFAEGATDTHGIETIVVTATRREETQQKIGLAVSAVNDKQLDAMAPKTLQDLNGVAPNVFIGMTTAGPGSSAIYIRGQGYQDVEKTQTTPVGVSLDGIFLGNSTGQLLDSFDVQQIEISRGPQGIFFGKNTTGGVISVTRTAPTREWGVRASASYGSFGSAIFKAVANMPLGDNAGLKIAGTWRDSYGYYNNIFTHTHAGGDRYAGINAVVDWDPTDWLNVRASYDHIDEKGGGSPAQYGNVLAANVVAGLFGHTTPNIFWSTPDPVTGGVYNPITGSPAGLGVRQIEQDFPDKDTLVEDIYNLILKADTPVGQLISQSAYIASKDVVNQDFDGTCSLFGCNPNFGIALLGVPFLHTIRTQPYSQFTQEVRLAGTAWGQLDYLAGFYYYQHTLGMHQNTNVAVDQFSGEHDHSWSLFGNLDWHATDALSVSAGLRYLNEQANFHTQFFVTLPPTVPITPLIADHHGWDNLQTRFAVNWQVTEDNLLYASRSQGFRSGGYSMRGTASETVLGQSNYDPANPTANFLSFAPEKVTAWEIGSKNEFFDNHILLNAALYQNQIRGFQQSSIVVTPGYGPGTNTYILNLPKVRTQGIEFEAVMKPDFLSDAFEGLTLSANLGLQNAKIVDGHVNGREVGFPSLGGPPGSVFDYTGITMSRIPKLNYALRGTYTTPVGDGDLTLNAGYTYTGRFSFATFGTAPDYQPGYGLVDASIAYDWSNYRLTVSGKNLTGEDYRNNSLPVVFFQGWAAPATWQVELQAHF
ncbi:MAG: TonB-dependent receptor [Rhizomicrobium sp.]